jgi:hypothetical protein
MVKRGGTEPPGPNAATPCHTEDVLLSCLDTPRRERFRRSVSRGDDFLFGQAADDEGRL